MRFRFKSFGVGTALLAMLPCALLYKGVLANSDGFCAGARFRNGGSFSGSNPVLSPDRSQLVFAAPTEEDDGEIFAVDLKTSRRTVLIRMRGYQGQQSLTPGMSILAFVNESSGMPEIWLADGVQKNVGRVTKSEWAEETPVISPDGQHIAFVRRLTHNPDDRKHDEIFVVGAQGTNERRLTNNRNQDFPLRFSSDSSSLYIITHDFSSTKTAASFQLNKIRLKDRNASTLLSWDEIASPTLSADEKTFAYAGRDADFNYNVFLQPLLRGSPQRKAQIPVSVGSVDFGFGTQAFTYLVDPNRDGLGDIFLYDIKTNTSKKIGSNSLLK